MLLEAIADKSALATHAWSSLANELSRIRYHFSKPVQNIWSIQARVYCENPSTDFKPVPGVLQHVSFPQPLPEWLRVDTWVKTGTTVTPFYDSLVAKIVTRGSTRDEAVSRMRKALHECKIWGPPNNVAYLDAVLESEVFKDGAAATRFLDTFTFTPRLVGWLRTRGWAGSSGTKRAAQEMRERYRSRRGQD